MDLISPLLSPLIIGAHLFSAHYTNPYNADKLNAINPGIYVSYSSGLSIGGFNNSYKRFSAYVGYTAKIPYTEFDFTVGGITGYSKATIIPLVAVSRVFQINGEYSGRVSLTPPSQYSAGVVHFSIERKW